MPTTRACGKVRLPLVEIAFPWPTSRKPDRPNFLDGYYCAARPGPPVPPRSSGRPRTGLPQRFPRRRSLTSRSRTATNAVTSAFSSCRRTLARLSRARSARWAGAGCSHRLRGNSRYELWGSLWRRIREDFSTIEPVLCPRSIGTTRPQRRPVSPGGGASQLFCSSVRWSLGSPTPTCRADRPMRCRFTPGKPGIAAAEFPS